MASKKIVQHSFDSTECDRDESGNACTDSLHSKRKKKHESKFHDIVNTEKMEKLCNIHSTLPYVMCCQQCEVPVCQRCVAQNHKNHSFCQIDAFFHSKKEQCDHNFLKVKEEILPNCHALLRDVQSDSKKCKEEIGKIQSAMTSNAQILKDIIDTVLAENIEFLHGLENSLISELQQQEKTMISHIAYLQDIVDEYEKYISTKEHAHFILFQQENPMSKAEEIPELKEIILPSFADVNVNKEDISRLLGKVNESSINLSGSRKIQNFQALKKSDPSMNKIPSATKIKSFTTNVWSSCHISPVAADQAWISNSSGDLVLTDMNGKKLGEMKYADYRNGCHTTSETGELIFLNKDDDGIYKVTADEKKPNLITKVPCETVKSIYSSPFNGDILVGIRKDEEARVIRYKKSGQEVHQIQHDNTGHPLYDDPVYITENHINRDVCVSDCVNHAIVVVDKDKKFRFSYTGHPPRSELWPRGISTDTQGHILVSDLNSNTVQMTDKDGRFLSFLLTTNQGLGMPIALSLDIKNSLLWVGEDWSDTVTVYKYKPQ